jgi:hypothetical protein
MAGSGMESFTLVQTLPGMTGTSTIFVVSAIYIGYEPR